MIQYWDFKRRTIMNNKKAIETIKNNWPPEKYTMLRESLGVAITRINGDTEMQAENIDLKERIAEMTNAAAAVLRIIKMMGKSYISDLDYNKLGMRSAYLESLVENERGNIAPHPEEFIDYNDTQVLDSEVKP